MVAVVVVVVGMLGVDVDAVQHDSEKSAPRFEDKFFCFLRHFRADGLRSQDEDDAVEAGGRDAGVGDGDDRRRCRR